MHVINN